MPLINIKHGGVNTEYCFGPDGNTAFKCECNPRFDGLRCEIFNAGDIDLCAVNEIPIECGNGTCIGGTCNCDNDYVNIDNFCEETCALTPCQDSDLISFSIDKKEIRMSFRRIMNSNDF